MFRENEEVVVRMPPSTIAVVAEGLVVRVSSEGLHLTEPYAKESSQGSFADSYTTITGLGLALGNCRMDKKAP